MLLNKSIINSMATYQAYQLIDFVKNYVNISSKMENKIVNDPLAMQILSDIEKNIIKNEKKNDDLEIRHLTNLFQLVNNLFEFNYNYGCDENILAIYKYVDLQNAESELKSLSKQINEFYDTLYDTNILTNVDHYFCFCKDSIETHENHIFDMPNVNDEENFLYVDLEKYKNYKEPTDVEISADLK